MRWAENVAEVIEVRISYSSFDGGNLKVNGHLEALDINGRLLLN